MDFSRGSELTEFEGRPVEMDHLNTRKSPAPEKGLDLSNSVLDRLSQKVMRSGSQKLHISLLVTFLLEQHLNTSLITLSSSPKTERNVQFIFFLRSCSPDHNGNASVVDKMPPLPPWLSRTAPQLEDSSDKPLSQDESSPRPRHLSDGSNGKIYFVFLFFFSVTICTRGLTLFRINPIF